MVAVGGDVKSVQPGDRVLIIGTVGLDVVTLPQEKELCLTKEANLICAWTETVELSKNDVERLQGTCVTPSA